MTRAEKIICDHLTARGYRILRNGWPDFLATAKDGTVYAVEVKRHLADPVRPAQAEMHRVLAAAGVEVVIAYADVHRECACHFHPCWRRSDKPAPALREAAA